MGGTTTSGATASASSTLPRSWPRTTRKRSHSRERARARMRKRNNAHTKKTCARGFTYRKAMRFNSIHRSTGTHTPAIQSSRLNEEECCFSPTGHTKKKRVSERKRDGDARVRERERERDEQCRWPRIAMCV